MTGEERRFTSHRQQPIKSRRTTAHAPSSYHNDVTAFMRLRAHFSKASPELIRRLTQGLITPKMH